MVEAKECIWKHKAKQDSAGSNAKSNGLQAEGQVSRRGMKTDVEVCVEFGQRKTIGPGKSRGEMPDWENFQQNQSCTLAGIRTASSQGTSNER